MPVDDGGGVSVGVGVEVSVEVGVSVGDSVSVGVAVTDVVGDGDSWTRERVRKARVVRLQRHLSAKHTGSAATVGRGVGNGLTGWVGIALVPLIAVP